MKFMENNLRWMIKKILKLIYKQFKLLFIILVKIKANNNPYYKNY